MLHVRLFIPKLHQCDRSSPSFRHELLVLSCCWYWPVLRPVLSPRLLALPSCKFPTWIHAVWEKANDKNLCRKVTKQNLFLLSHKRYRPQFSSEVHRCWTGEGAAYCLWQQVVKLFTYIKTLSTKTQPSLICIAVDTVSKNLDATILPSFTHFCEEL